MRSFTGRRGAAAASLLILASASAHAQQQPPADQADQGSAPGGIEDIVVTATRQPTNVQDTALAITAVIASAVS